MALNASTYSLVMANTTIVGDATLLIVHTATSSTPGSVIYVLRAWVSQTGTETSEQLGVMIAEKDASFGTYTSRQPISHSIPGLGSQIAGGTAGAAGTSGIDASAEGAGATFTIIQDGFNNLNGWLWVPTPEERILVAPDQAIIVKLVGTPTTLTGWNAGLTFEILQ